MTKIISPQTAKEHGMRPLTKADYPSSPFIKSVASDMQRVPGTIWSLVDVGQKKVEVWRVPCAAGMAE